MNSYKKTEDGATRDKEAPCHYCQERPLPGGNPWPLCGGCKRVVFCGKACLKTGWKEHKALCKELNKITSTASPNPTTEDISIPKLLVENFVGIHRIHFIGACNSAVEMQGGHNSFDFSRFTLVFNLKYNALSNGNPSLAFSVTHASFLDTSCINLGSNYNLIARNQIVEFERARTWASRNNTANFKTIVSVCYEIEGVTTWSGLPISGSAYEKEGATNLLESHGGWLDALQRLVGTGRVLRETKSSPPSIEFGRYILERDKWRFKRYSKTQLHQLRDEGVLEAGIVLDTGLL